MPLPTINGLKGAFPQPEEYGEDESGAYTHAKWEGTTLEIAQMIPLIRAVGGLYHVTKGYTGARDIIEARIPIWINSNETPVDDWEFQATEVEKDAMQVDSPEIDAIPYPQKKIIRRAIATFDAADDDPNAIPEGLTDPAGIELYRLMIDGFESIRVAVPTLRHTQTVSSLWAIRASLNYVEKLISTNSLTALENIPAETLITLPNKISSRAGLFYGWYKKYPTVRKSAGHRAQIEQEWEYGLWARLAYGIPL